MKKGLLLLLFACCLSVGAEGVIVLDEGFDGANFTSGPLSSPTGLPGIEIVTEPVTSPPHALKVARSGGHAFIDVRLTDTVPTQHSYDLSFRVLLTPGSRAVIVACDNRGKSIIGLELIGGNQVRIFTAQNKSETCSGLPSTPTGQWLRFNLSFDASKNSHYLTFTDAAGKSSESEITCPVIGGSSPPFLLKVSNAHSGGGDPVFFDDLKFEYASAATLAEHSPDGAAAADLARITAHFQNAKPEFWRWVFYGDSITHGARSTRGWRSYPEVFQERLRYELGQPRRMDVVINCGLSGRSTYHLLEEGIYNPMVRDLKPQVVFLLIGANDIVHPRGSLETFKNNLTELIKRIRRDKAIPVVQTFNTMAEFINPTEQWQHEYVIRYKEFPAYNQAIRDVAKASDCLLVDHYSHWSKAAADLKILNTWLDDQLHPGAKGHIEMAKTIFQALQAYSPSSYCLSIDPLADKP